MRRRELQRSGGAARGLWLDVDGPEVPGLRVEVAPPRLLRIVQGDDTVLLAWVEPGRWGAEVVRTGLYRSPLDPVRAVEARRRIAGDPGAATWYAGWCHAFAGALDGAVGGPLHRGAWTLRPARVWGATGRSRVGEEGIEPASVGLDPTLLVASEAYVDWGAAGAGEVLPLRPLSPPGDGRVRAHAKLVDEGALPPVLVWWVAGLTCPVVLDGHDRLAAARHEGVPPPVLELASVRPVDDVRPQDPPPRALDQLEALAERGDTTSPHARALSVALAHEQLAVEERVRTQAWPIPGGEATWVAAAQRHAPTWLDELRAAVDDDPVERARLVAPPAEGR